MKLIREFSGRLYGNIINLELWKRIKSMLFPSSNVYPSSTLYPNKKIEE